MFTGTGTRRRIAVVGGGVAGLGAAWSLSSKFDVTLFEKSDYLGGHARSIPVRSTHVDAGFQIYHEWLYPNLAALFRRFNVETAPITGGRLTYSLNFGDGNISNDHVSGSLKPFLEEALRFESETPDLVVDSEAYVDLMTAEYLELKGYSKQFLYRCLIPQLSILFVTPKKLDMIPIQLVARLFGPVALISFQDSPALRTVFGGSKNYVEKLVADTDAKFRLGTPIESITRTRNVVNVTTAGGGCETFDEVVMATDAETALKLLVDASAEERMLLKAFQYAPVSTVIHTDTVVMPPNRGHWAGYTYVTDEVTGPYENSIRSYYVPMMQRWVDFDLFVSFDVPAGRLDPAKVITEFQWKHLVMDLEQILASAELHRIQGRRKTWFCGEYTSVAFGHEFSFTSGLAVAKALGADYPFEDSPLARLAFYDQAFHQMRLVGAFKRGVGTRYNPLIDSGKCAAESLKRRLRREIRAEFRRRIPRRLRATIFALPGVEKLLVEAVARRTSFFEAYQEMQSR